MAVNFLASAARAQNRWRARDTPRELKQQASGWRATYKERHENELRQSGVVIPLSDWLGHNNGPDILAETTLIGRQWAKARREAFAPPDMETGRRWAAKAEALGLTYEEYRLELLERGRHPTQEDASRIATRRPAQARLIDV